MESSSEGVLVAFEGVHFRTGRVRVVRVVGVAVVVSTGFIRLSLGVVPRHVYEVACSVTATVYLTNIHIVAEGMVEQGYLPVHVRSKVITIFL